MNFNKIKEVVVEKKIYIIATIVLVAVFGLKKAIIKKA